MDSVTRRTYIRVHLAKAQEDLATGRDNLAGDHFRAAVNRVYYAVFHAASAALLWLDVQRARHSGVQAALGEFLIKSGTIEPEFGEIYTRARKARETQDYVLDAAPITAQEAKRIVTDAERFMTRLERYLREVGAIE